jgi:hypothetical protein
MEIYKNPENWGPQLPPFGVLNFNQQNVKNSRALASSSPEAKYMLSLSKTPQMALLLPRNFF